MKKILGISLVAIMAVGAANAQIASKGYVDETFATQAFVSGNDTLAASFGDNPTVVGAINSLNTTLGTVSGTAGTAVQSVTTGESGVGTIMVDDTQVTVHGLGTAAAAATTDFDAAGAASDLVGTLPVNPDAETPGDRYETVGAALAAMNTTIASVSGTAGTAVQSVTTGESGVGTIMVDDTQVTVHGLGTAAAAATTDFTPAVATNTTGTDGEYVLTMKVVQGEAEYKWEAIQR